MSELCMLRGVYDSARENCVCSDGYAGQYCQYCSYFTAFNLNGSVCTDQCFFDGDSNNCEVCNNKVCIRCKKNSVLHHNKCYPLFCDTNCADCQMTGLGAEGTITGFYKCARCKKDYYLENNRCVFQACDSNCETCNGHLCRECKRGHLTNGFCILENTHYIVIASSGLTVFVCTVVCMLLARRTVLRRRQYYCEMETRFDSGMHFQ